MRLLLRRVIRLSHRDVSVSAGAGSGLSRGCLGPSCCRCFSDAASDRNTHFGFETVPEAEKAKRGELTADSVSSTVRTEDHSFIPLFRSPLTFRT